MPPKRRQSTTAFTAASSEPSQKDAKKPRLSSRNPSTPAIETAASSRPKRATRPSQIAEESQASDALKGTRNRSTGANARSKKQEEAEKKLKQSGPTPAVSAKNGIKTEPKNKKTIDGAQGEEDGPKSYWLMKAEPESRMEKGVDVKFSIDDLREATEPEPWDEEHPIARNNMRSMKKGDLAFFYHSNCKVPGIAGIMEIVREHSIDESAFDPGHPYYDPKSNRENPKWEVVHVEFRRKFKNLITLAELKSFAKPGGPLENMQMTKQSRLSVSAVSGEEWRFIMGLVGEE
ncbi:hypothetical protein EMCG_07911 [[Emmonsia] crescens]|uniref:Thymocyte nuclear protein 1 n=1 Tax=[Emmonsia] crescens TaxID=73230 RepID=A0A0G2I732_9EURO|nr:hypothetical protein EMCG_07911 [Emmonsia crescens UAMH 3008]